MVKLKKYRELKDGDKITDTICAWSAFPSVKQIRQKFKHPDDFGIEMLIRGRSVKLDTHWYYLERVKR